MEATAVPVASIEGPWPTTESKVTSECETESNWETSKSEESDSSDSPDESSEEEEEGDKEGTELKPGPERFPERGPDPGPAAPPRNKIGPDPASDSAKSPDTRQRHHQAPVQYRYHEYRFGPPDIDWVQWLAELDSGNSQATGKPADQDISSAEESDMEWIPGPAEDSEDDDEMDVRSDAESVLTGPAAAHVPQGNPGVLDEDDQGPNNHSGRILTAADIRQLKESTLLTYPSGQFVKLPQFKHFLGNLSKDQLVDFLRSAWGLNTASVEVKIVTTFAVQHPDSAIREAILAACSESVEETFDDINSHSAQNQFDLVPVLRMKSEESLRELVQNHCVNSMRTHEIIPWMASLGGMDRTSLIELYGSAIVLGGLNGSGFGLDSEDW